MTEEEITQCIGLWWLYALVGNPEEVDYGPEMPRGVISAGLESQYRSPQIWHAPELQKVATKADFDLVEPVFRKRSTRDKMTICYYSRHPAKAIGFNDRDVIESFRADVGRA